MRISLPEFIPVPETDLNPYTVNYRKPCVHLTLPKEVFWRLEQITTGEDKKISKTGLITLLLARFFHAQDHKDTMMNAQMPRYIYSNPKYLMVEAELGQARFQHIPE